MRIIPCIAIFAIALTFFFGRHAVAQHAKKDNVNSGTFAIHIRELTKPEEVLQKRVAEADTVLDAVAALKLVPNLSKMDLWIVRKGLDGMVQVLAIDWVAITDRGEVGTNFLILPGDRLMIQARLRK